MFTSIFDPFQRAAEKPGSGGDGDLFRIDAIFRTESAAHVGRHDPQAIFLYPRRLHNRLEQIIGHLRRRPEVQSTIGPAFGDDTACLHRMSAAAMLPQIFAKDMIGGSESRGDVAIGDLDDG